MSSTPDISTTGQVLAAFVIFLREGTEARIIVTILCSCLDRCRQHRHFRDVFVGVGLGVVCAAAGGLVADETIRSYCGSRVQTVFETATYLLAVLVQTDMTFSMRRQARAMAHDLAERAKSAAGRRERYALGLRAFQAIGREGLETAVSRWRLFSPPGRTAPSRPRPPGLSPPSGSPSPSTGSAGGSISGSSSSSARSCWSSPWSSPPTSWRTSRVGPGARRLRRPVHGRQRPRSR